MVYLIIAASILFRFVPHPPDFSPVYASLLLSGAVLKKRYSVLFPLLIISASDVMLTPAIYGVSIGRGQVLTWIAFAATTMCGWVLRHNLRWWRVVGAALAAPMMFFLISDFGVWLTSHLYPHSPSGLALWYVAALPFYGHALASTCICGALIVGLYWAWLRVSPLSGAQVQAR